MKSRNRCAVSGLLVGLTLAAGCGGLRQELRAEMEPLEIGKEPVPVTRDHFTRDGSGSISEEDLRRVLAAPVFLEEATRIGVVPVATCYEPDPDLPLAIVPGELSKSLEESGLFSVTTEVSTDWPADRGISGLRELAARYRAPYLLLYRHRFVDDVYTNAWGFAYFTLLGTLFVPSQTLQADGVLEATLFDVRTGTLLFTVYSRVHGESRENIWHNERKVRELKTKLLTDAARTLAEQVVAKSRKLAVARPPKPEAVSAVAP